MKTKISTTSAQQKFSMREYLNNRPDWTWEQLAPYIGQWVAFSSDAKRIVANAASLDALYDAVIQSGEGLDQVAVEYIPTDEEQEELQLGGAGLMA